MPAQQTETLHESANESADVPAHATLPADSIHPWILRDRNNRTFAGWSLFTLRNESVLRSDHGVEHPAESLQAVLLP